MAGPLRGIRVLDLSRVLAGPWCTQILADLGADVIKLERPGVGDETRHWGPPWFVDQYGSETEMSAYYLSANRGKRSIAVDLRNPAGQEIARQLAMRSDVLIENFKTGDLARKGLAYEDLKKDNQRLVYCSITGFGQTGPMSQLPGYDYLIQAQSGLMSITGVPDDEPGSGPQRVGVAASDLTTGMNAAIAVLAALHHRDKSGKGQFIDLALLDVQVSWLANQAQNYFCSGKVPTRTGLHHPNLAPYQPLPTSDGSLIIAVGNDRQFEHLCSVLGLKHLSTDARFATNPRRVEHRDSLINELQCATRRWTSLQLQRLLREKNIPCGSLQSIDAVFEDPQVLARNMVVNVEHRRLGTIPTVANPVKYSSTPIEYCTAPPLLGEDTDSVLSELLGMDESRISKYRARGVIA